MQIQYVLIMLSYPMGGERKLPIKHGTLIFHDQDQWNQTAEALSLSEKVHIVKSIRVYVHGKPLDFRDARSLSDVLYALEDAAEECRSAVNKSAKSA